MATLLGEVYSAPNVNEEYDKDKYVTNSIYTISYYVQGSSSEGPGSILSVSGLPEIGDNVRINGELYTGAPCVRRRITEHDTNSNIWTVECEFDDSVTVRQQEEGQEQDPTDLRPKWSWTFDTIDLVVPRDAITGATIANTAGEPLIITAPVAIPILKIERYQWVFDPDTIYAYVNFVNSTPFWGADAKSALMAGIEDVPETVNGRDLRKVTYTIRFKRDTWTEMLLNHGSRWKNPVYGGGIPQYVNFTDDSGNPTTGNLAMTGLPLNIGDDPVYLPYDKYATANFNQLALGPW